MDTTGDARNESEEQGGTAEEQIGRSGEQGGTPGAPADGGAGQQGAASGEGTEGGTSQPVDDGAAEENPLAHLDPDKIAAGTDGPRDSALFNDPSADPLWNPSLESDPATNPVSGGTNADGNSGSGPEGSTGDGQ